MRKNKNLKLIIIFILALIIISACVTTVFRPTRVDKILANVPEKDRVVEYHYIKAIEAQDKYRVYGDSIKIILLGEMVDIDHPDLEGSIINQYDTFKSQGKSVIRGYKGVSPAYNEFFYGTEMGHGTHIAGIISGNMDGLGIQGIAPNSTIDVYRTHAYNINTFMETNKEEFAPANSNFVNRYYTQGVDLDSLITSILDIAQQNSSKIVSASFSINGAVPPELVDYNYKKDEDLDEANNNFADQVKTIDEFRRFAQAYNLKLLPFLEKTFFPILKERINDSASPKDIAEAISSEYYAFLLPASPYWKRLEDAFVKLQNNDIVYIAAEPNVLVGAPSIIGALPKISDKVSEDLFIMIVMLYYDVKSETFFSPYNVATDTAYEYTIATPSGMVLSTVTKLANFGNNNKYSEVSALEFDGRTFSSYGGSSMGAPMVASALALMQELNNREGYGYTMRDLVRILKDSASTDFQGYDKYQHGRGMLDVLAALDMMSSKAKKNN